MVFPLDGIHDSWNSFPVTYEVLKDETDKPVTFTMAPLVTSSRNHPIIFGRTKDDIAVKPFKHVYDDNSTFLRPSFSERSLSCAPASSEKDVVDNPPKFATTLRITEQDKELLQSMKYEQNRLNSFNKKWPLEYITPSEMAKAGFFYLQAEDRVQCAFCRSIIEHWKLGDKPLKEHMKFSPRCPFLLTTGVGNVPIALQNVEASKKMVQNEVPLNTAPYRPKFPRMADWRNRLLTYKKWPLIMLSSEQLARCGLFYTGVADVVTCYFCGGSLGNWELGDDPNVEHQKFFPACPYLSLVKRRGNSAAKAAGTSTSKDFNISASALSTNSTCLQSGGSLQAPCILPSSAPSTNFSNLLEHELIQQASSIFPTSLVEKVVEKHLKDTSCHFGTLDDLCDAILEFKEKEKKRNGVQNTGKSEDIPNDFVLPNINGQTNVKDVLQCKICMDQERSIAFQPCGHLIACAQCASQIYDCPMCRTPITYKVRTYLS